MYTRTAARSAGSSTGYFCRTAASVAPRNARFSYTSRTVIGKRRMHGWPSMCSGSTVMRSVKFMNHNYESRNHRTLTMLSWNRRTLTPSYQRPQMFTVCLCQHRFLVLCEEHVLLPRPEYRQFLHLRRQSLSHEEIESDTADINPVDV